MKDPRLKWVKASLVIIILVAALYFAYHSFESSFTVRGGIPDHNGPPPMSPAMLQKMKEANQKHSETANTKAEAKKPDDKKSGNTPAGTETGSGETHSKGGE